MMLNHVSTQASNIEEAAIQKQVLDGLAAGNAALKEIQNVCQSQSVGVFTGTHVNTHWWMQTMSIDDVQDVMDGLKDGLEYANVSWRTLL